MPILNNLSFEPALNQVYGRMGFKPWKSDIPESMLPLVDQAIELGRSLVRPQACWEMQSIVEITPDGLKTGAGLAISSRKVVDWMKGCHQLYLTAVTLGDALDKTVSELTLNNQMTLGFLLNAYGAEAAEALMESLDQHLRAKAQTEDFQTTKRYSPGYGDWDISAQKELLSLIHADQIGITLTESYLMIPEKSVSAIIGVRRG